MALMGREKKYQTKYQQKNCWVAHSSGDIPHGFHMGTHSRGPKPTDCLPSNLELALGTTLDGNLETNICEIINQFFGKFQQMDSIFSFTKKNWSSKQKKTSKFRKKKACRVDGSLI
jgi:hypothetical protein